MNPMIRTAVTLSMLALSGSVFGQCQAPCSEVGAGNTAQVVRASWSGDDIVQTAMKAGKFGTLVAALKAAGWVEPLKGEGPFTVFAPTDEAFRKLPPGTVEMLLKPENKEKLGSILTYHVVPGAVTAEKVMGMKTATTVNGQRIDIATRNGKVWLDGKATFTMADVKASNGVIHAIDTVIMPVEKDLVTVASEAGSFNTLAKALASAGLVDVLKGKGPFTVFAPTDEAFAKLPAGTLENLMMPANKDQLKAILTFHVLPARVYADKAVTMTESIKTVQGSTFAISAKDGKVMIGNAKAMATMTATDIEASNGVIHVIDSVIMPK
jgi:transforming growth factor-beta-induced protein